MFKRNTKKFFKDKKCVIITTIQPATKAVRLFADNRDYDLILVGDKKSPLTYSVRGRYLDLKTQKKIESEFSSSLPFNHYCRKNLGYVYAIRNGYHVIADTDDDNMPLNFWGNLPKDEKHLVITSPKFPNIYKEFTKHYIWPRGFPLDLILSNKKNKKVFKKSNPVIWQGLADNNPDVDAVYRLVNNSPVYFERKRPVVLDKGIISPFNSQNTFWLPESYLFLYLPHTVTFRYTDILRSFVAQFGLWAKGFNVGFFGPTVKQERNLHNLLNDFKDECPMYNTFYKVIEILENCKLTGKREDLMSMYKALFKSGIVLEKELNSVRVWLDVLKTYA